jgi:hypothetical protein
MKSYFFYYKYSIPREPIQSVKASSRLKAALYFSAGKRLPLREFLKVFSVSR